MNNSTTTPTERKRVSNYNSFVQPQASKECLNASDLVAIPLRIQARLNAAQTARILGFAERDIPILVNHNLLRPLGKPALNAIKYFPAHEIEQLAQNSEWLGTATQVVYDYWKGKNQRKIAV